MTKEKSLDTENNARQFDFWLGEWDLTWGDDGRGSNRVSTILDEHVIQEEFDGTPSIPLKGISVSAFNFNLGKWQQTWVDNSGSYLDLVGEFKNGEMILEREANIQGKSIKQRMIFYNISDDNLDWNWERSDDDGENWQVLWKIHYTRKK